MIFTQRVEKFADFGHPLYVLILELLKPKIHI